jgi:aromatic ring-opening dioxygenase catalytic subunit (LigB family)
MADVVAAMAMTHSPGLCGWFDDAPEDEQATARGAFERMRAHLAEREVDTLVIFANDHLLNWPINNTPEYTVGIADSHVGPHEWYRGWLNLDPYRVPGDSALARYIVNEAAGHGVAMAYLREMQFDDNISVPTTHLNPDHRIATVPITMNCTVPPIPSPRRAYAVGETIRQIIADYDGGERIAVIGSGGLSHEPGGPRYLYIDEEFDRWFLEMLADGDHEALLEQCTLERMEEAGSGGTAELIAWFAALPFTKGGADVMGYVPSHTWRSGTGMIVWPELAAAAAKPRPAIAAE